VKYLHKVVEQDHRAVKRVTRPMMGFNAFDAAQCTPTGIQLMHRLRKSQREEGVAQDLTPAEQFYALAAQSPHRQAGPTAHRPHSKIGDKAQRTILIHGSRSWSPGRASRGAHDG
jgi:hypothetical protein